MSSYVCCVGSPSSAAEQRHTNTSEATGGREKGLCGELDGAPCAVCVTAIAEDVDYRAAAIRIKAGRTKACIVGRNGASAFEGKNIKKPVDQQLTLRGASQTGVPLEKLIFCVHSDACVHAAAGCWCCRVARMFALR